MKSSGDSLAACPLLLDFSEYVIVVVTVERMLFSGTSVNSIGSNPDILISALLWRFWWGRGGKGVKMSELYRAVNETNAELKRQEIRTRQERAMGLRNN